MTSHPMTMVERVARAVCKAGGGDPDIVLAINDSPSGRPAVDDCARPLWRNYITAARAAIEAMPATLHVKP